MSLGPFSSWCKSHAKLLGRSWLRGSWGLLLPVTWLQEWLWPGDCSYRGGWWCGLLVVGCWLLFVVVSEAGLRNGVYVNIRWKLIGNTLESCEQEPSTPGLNPSRESPKNGIKSRLTALSRRCFAPPLQLRPLCVFALSEPFQTPVVAHGHEQPVQELHRCPLHKENAVKFVQKPLLTDA